MMLLPLNANTGNAAHSDKRLNHCPAITFLCVVLLAVSACIPVPRGHNPLNLQFMSSDELRGYVEKVFRHHNRVTTRLMMMPLDDSVSQAKRKQLEKAEVRMNDACSSLNKIASERARGEDSGIKLENRVRRNVRQCQRNTLRVEGILDRIENESGSG